MNYYLFNFKVDLWKGIFRLYESKGREDHLFRIVDYGMDDVNGKYDQNSSYWEEQFRKNHETK